VSNQKTQTSGTKPKLVFALGGEIVKTPAEAKRVLVRAISKNQDWLIPQAESVLSQLRAEVPA
jgi:hypothetical protein